MNDQPSSSPPEAEDEFNVELITIISPGISTVFALIAIFSHLISSYVSVSLSFDKFVKFVIGINAHLKKARSLPVPTFL